MTKMSGKPFAESGFTPALQQSAGLTADQLAQYLELGYVSNVCIFDPTEVADLQAGFERLCELLDADETPYVMDGWERHNDWLRGVFTNARLLDCVESLIGPNFHNWGSNCMSKKPGEGLYVPWHQDIYDWPLAPLHLATCWLAFDDVDEENGCLQVLPETHRLGRLPHRGERPDPRNGQVALLPFFVEEEYVEGRSPVSLPLRAGEASFHHPQLIHGSEGNLSTRRRCGFQVCYAATDVYCDTQFRNGNGDWSDFSILMCRGTDEFRYHAHLPPPRAFGRGPRKTYRELAFLDS